MEKKSLVKGINGVHMLEGRGGSDVIDANQVKKALAFAWLLHFFLLLPNSN